MATTSPEEMARRLAMLQRGQQLNMAPLPAQQQPTWQQHSAQLSALRAQRPVGPPVPAGTPTMSGITHDEGVRQYDVGHEEGVRQYDKSMAFNREQFAADERYRAAQLALARMKGGSGGYKLPAQDPVIYSNIQQRLRDRVEMYKQSVLSDFPDRQIRPGMKKNIGKRAADMAMRDFLQDAPALGVTAKQQKETLDWLYRIYGIQDTDDAERLKQLDAGAKIKAGAYGPDYDSKGTALTPELMQEMQRILGGR